MRNNQPVSQQETIVPDGVFIYSRTDTQGNITEANQAFAEISGFEQAEMLGQPHNLIRHPDMPEEAFADMWRNLKQGRPWRGLVKNRRKDGGYYWVRANASPVREQGRIVAYQSVRTPPGRDEVVAVEQLYRRIRQGDRSIRIENGRVVRNQAAWRMMAKGFGFQLYFTLFLLLASLVLGLLSTRFSDITSQFYWVAALALLFGLWQLFVTMPRTMGRLNRIHHFLNDLLSTGNLQASLQPTRNDIISHIATELDNQTAAVAATLQVMQNAARNVQDTSGRLNRSVAEMVSAASLQTDKTSESAATIEQLAASIGLIARHAHDTESVTRDVGSKAEEASRLSEHATETIRALAVSVIGSAETVEQLGVRTEDIGKVANVIKDIAEQTNLLALNAAIEAARAGETGRGFAVVADEVRKLAERTAKATLEIDKMIARIQADTSGAVGSMRQSAAQVNTSVNLVHQAHGVLDEISLQMSRAVGMVGEISHSADEQKAGMDLMEQSLESVAALTDQNLQIARATESDSSQLQINVERMSKAVAQYKV
ncbi:methyl-accepting chemotaxis protein [Aquitalea denitrificans]|uniref:methyl-accepting chemotaxis protein n=1 Tax=Aquitalea denitrificans TaxID=519081 RepID=UPI00135C3B76|nr:methyl-accepting chemotaxis protein [Aquitalea denitrificans]